jgi:hypothetical protein
MIISSAGSSSDMPSTSKPHTRFATEADARTFTVFIPIKSFL